MAVSELLASCHGDGRAVFNALNDLHEHTQEIHIAHLTFAAMVRLRVLEQRIEELKGELARLDAVARVGY
jgi:hypothetical protein